MKDTPTFKFIKTERNCKNYSIATPFNGVHNRKVNTSSVNSISEKIKTNGFIGYITLIETRAFGKLEIRIVDGQHRLAAAELAKSGFNYELIRLVDDTKKNVTKFISGMNSVGTRWSNNNHLDKQVELGTAEYILFKKCLDESSLKITDLLHIFLGGAGTKEVSAFKSGEMKFSNPIQSVKLYESVKKLSAYLPNKAFSRRALYKSLKTVSLRKLEKAIIGNKKLINIENEEKLELAIMKLAA